MGVRAWARERGKDQAVEAISGRGERGYNDSQIPNQDTAVSALWTGLGQKRSKHHPPVPGCRFLQDLGTAALLTRRQAVCRCHHYLWTQHICLQLPLHREVGHSYRRQPVFIEPESVQPTRPQEIVTREGFT